MVKKVESQMKAHLFDSEDPITMIGFLTTSKFACDTNHIQEGAAMWALPHYVNETLANSLDSRMCATDKSYPIATSLRNVDNQSHKLLRLYPDVVNYLLKKFATDPAIAGFDAAILLYMQAGNMTPEQYADDVVAKSCKVTDVFDKCTLNDVIIEGVDPSIPTVSDTIELRTLKRI